MSMNFSGFDVNSMVCNDIFALSTILLQSHIRTRIYWPASTHALSSNSSAIIILAGDFNHLPNDDFLSLGLHSLVNLPTHKGHLLDRLYCTQPLYTNIKVITSAINTAYQMIIARCDYLFISDVHEQHCLISKAERFQEL